MNDVLDKRQRKRVKEALAYVDELIRDESLRSDLRSAVGHGKTVTDRARKGSGVLGVSDRLVSDPKLRKNLRALLDDLDSAGERVRTKRTHRFRNTVLLLGGTGAVLAFVPAARRRVAKLLSPAKTASSHALATVEETIEVDVPVHAAYEQWTQFEEFPRFMEGIEEVRRIDDTLLHWAANVSGKRREWDAKIIDQSPDRRVAWKSVGGKELDGVVSFEPAGPDRTRVRVEMTYTPDLLEWVGSTVGLDDRRVRGDLDRFKALVEGRA